MLTRVVLDANVIVSALIKPEGVHGIVFKEILTKEEYLLIISDEIIDELKNTLSYPKVRKYINLSDDHIDPWLTSVQVNAHIINPRFKYPPIVLDDPKDDCYVITALEGKAHCIVSGDKHLLRLHPYQGINILNPSDFLAHYSTP